MKILVDCSNLVKGGGMQVASSFLNDLNELESRPEIIVILSSQLEKIIEIEKFKNGFKFITIPEGIRKSAFSRGRQVKIIEQEALPDVSFVVFGPSYHKSKVPKIVGYAIPHFIYTQSPYFNYLSFLNRLRFQLLKTIQIFYFKRNSDCIVFETEDAQSLFCKKFHYPLGKTFVVSNALNQIFLKPQYWEMRHFNFSSSNNILCLAASYKHKNLAIIPQVIDHLLQVYGEPQFKFVLSQTKEDLNFPEHYNKYIEYIGKVKLAELPSLYSSVQMLFMPTLLEVFSTTYLEAMYMKVPIITTDFSFNRAVCGDAAIYFEPTNAQDAAHKIQLLIENKELKECLSHKGDLNVKKFESSKRRTDAYLNIISKFSQ